MRGRAFRAAVEAGQAAAAKIGVPLSAEKVADLRACVAVSMSRETWTVSWKLDDAALEERAHAGRSQGTSTSGSPFVGLK
jgi:hypothetical protein